MTEKTIDKIYQAPKLDRFGTLSELSAGGSGGELEPGMSMGMSMGMAMGMARQRP